MNRRQIVKLLSSLSLLSLLPSWSLAQDNKAKKAKADAKKAMADGKGKKEDKGKEPKNLISESDTLAKAMQYKHDAKQAKLRTDKKANCANCAKYNLCMDGDKSCKPLDAKALKTATAAPCQIFKAKVVKAEGWCLSWQKKG